MTGRAGALHKIKHRLKLKTRAYWRRCWRAWRFFQAFAVLCWSLLAVPLMLLMSPLLLIFFLLRQRWRPSQQAYPWTSVAPRQEDLSGEASSTPRLVRYPREWGQPEGPYLADTLLPDGLTLNSVDTVRECEEESLTVALYYGNAATLLVYDRAAACLYTFQEPSQRSRYEAQFERMHTAPRRVAEELRAALPQAHSAVTLRKVLGLLMAPSTLTPAARLTRRLRNGSLLEACLLLPPDLRGAPEPEKMLKLAPYELILNGQHTGLHGPGFDELMESPQGLCLLVAGWVLDRDHVVERIWHLWRHGRWHATLCHSAIAWNGTLACYLQPQSIGDDGRVQFGLQPQPGHDGLTGPLPRKVKLRVSWRHSELTLRPQRDTIALQLPASPARRAGLSWRSIGPTPDDLCGHASQDDRILADSEVGMGGPIVSTIMSREGVILENLASNIRDLDQGRLRIALQYDGSVRVYDRDSCCLYTLHRLYKNATAQASFKRLENISLQAAKHVRAPLKLRVENDAAQAAREVRAACEHAASCVTLHNAYGLMIDTSIAAPPAHLQRRLRNGSLLEAHVLLPPDLRGAADPQRMLNLAPYRLTLDGQHTGLHSVGLDDLQESPTGACVLLAGRILSGTYGPRCWHVWHGGRWLATLAEASAVGAEPRVHYDLLPVVVGDDGHLQFTLARQPYGADGALGVRVRQVALRVSWADREMVLRPENGIITVQLPRATQR